MNYDKNLRFRYSQLFLKTLSCKSRLLRKGYKARKKMFGNFGRSGIGGKNDAVFCTFQGENPRFENFQTFFPFTFYPSLNKLFYRVIDSFPAKHHQ